MFLKFCLSFLLFLLLLSFPWLTLLCLQRLTITGSNFATVPSSNCTAAFAPRSSPPDRLFADCQ